MIVMIVIGFEILDFKTWRGKTEGQKTATLKDKRLDHNGIE